MHRRFDTIRSVALLAVVLLLQILFFAGTITFAFSDATLLDAQEGVLETVEGGVFNIGKLFSLLSLRLIYGMSIISVMSAAIVICLLFVYKRLENFVILSIVDTACFAGLCSLLAGICSVMSHLQHSNSVMPGISMLFWAILFLPVSWVMSRRGWRGTAFSFIFRLWMALNIFTALCEILILSPELVDYGHLSCFLMLFVINLSSSIEDIRTLIRKGRSKVFSFILLSKLAMLAVSTLGIIAWFTRLSDLINFLMQGGLLFSALAMGLNTTWNTLRTSVLYQNYSLLRQREEENRLVAQFTSRYMIRYEHETKKMVCREETSQLLGMPAVMENMPDSFPVDHISPKTRLTLRQLWQQVLAGEEDGTAAICYLQPVTGENLWLRVDFITSFQQNHQPDYTVFTFTQIKGVQSREETYRKHQQESVRLAQQGGVVYEVDLTGDRFLAIKGTPFFGMPDILPEDMGNLSDYLEEYMLPKEEAGAVSRLLNRDWLLDQYERENSTHTLEFRRNTMGMLHWTQLEIQLLTEPYSDNVLAFLMFQDIEEEKKLRQLGESRVHGDELTGLMSRSTFTDSFTRILESSLDSDVHVLYMVDLDGFKYVNDTYGHSFGDKVLREVADSLRSLFRSDDLICRYGGDEFVVLMKSVQGDDAFILQRGRQICQALTRQFGDEVAMGASVGASIYPRHSKDFDILFRMADQALYNAKNVGRSQCMIYDESFSKGNRIIMTAQDEPRPPEEHGKVLLLMDGGRVERDMLSDDYTLRDAENPEAAKAILLSDPHISAALVDISDPSLGGLDLIHWMRNGDMSHHVQVLALGSWQDHGEEKASQAIQNGADDVLALPTSPGLMKLRVNNLILQGESERLRSQNQTLLLQRATKARHQKQLQYLADHDSVTHIYNKSAFFRRTRTLLDENQSRTYALVCFDIIRFRAVNDIFGYEAGDQLLRHIATQMQTIVGEKGVCARIATDMFAMCIPNDDVEATLAALSASVKDYNFRFVVQLCYGVYTVDDLSLSVNQMMDRASMAERSVKGSYVRNVAWYDDSMSLRLQEEQRMLSDMEQGLKNGEFIVYYQPKCRLDTGKIVGAEALVRWDHPRRGLLMPGTFVPIFEKNGFIMKLDEYIWEQVCIFLKKCRETDPECTPHISVNLSRVDLYNPQLCDTLEELCRKYGVPNEQMEVEITESAYVDNAHLLLDLAEKFHERGFNVQMDDFGSGYSSLNMLNEIPVDVLKLDMRFLYRFSQEGRSSSILSSIVSMTKNLRISVIAEGVETEEQARFLAGIGCKHAQGFFYHKPMTGDEFLTLIRREMQEISNVHDMESAKLYLSQLLTPAILVSRQGDRMEMLACNDYYFSMVQITDANFSRSDRVLNRWIGAADEKNLHAAMDQARETDKPVPCCYLQQDLSGGYHLLDSVVEFVSDAQEGLLYVMILTERY